MTATTTNGPVPPLPALSAPANILAEARTNCAARLRARGLVSAAEQIERDGAGWAVRHEVARLQAERGRRVEHVPV